MDPAVVPPGPPVVELIDPLTRFVRSRVSDSHDVADIVQETLTRVLAAEARLGEGPLIGYAIVVARNVISDRYRDTQRDQLALPRLVDMTEGQRPDDAAVEAEESAAMSAAFVSLPTNEHDSLRDHVVGQTDVATMAAASGSSNGAVGARLARARARLRVNFVLALRRVELPTAECRPVLLALSAADLRRQAALDAGSHLSNCPTCAELAEPLRSRSRAVAGVLPWLPASLGAPALTRFIKQRAFQVTAATGAATAGAVVAVMVLTGQPAPVSALMAGDGTSLLPAPRPLTEYVGQTARATGVEVAMVPSDEGFWVGAANGPRVWVQLETGGGESPMRVSAGQHLSFEGKVVPNTSQFLSRLSLTTGQGADMLSGQGAHVQVAERGIRIDSPGTAAPPRS